MSYSPPQKYRIRFPFCWEQQKAEKDNRLRRHLYLAVKVTKLNVEKRGAYFNEGEKYSFLFYHYPTQYVSIAL